MSALQGRSKLPFESMPNHFRCSHRGMRPDVCRNTLTRFSTLAVARTAADILPLPDGSCTLSFLQPPVPGFFCPFCSSFKSVRWDRLATHVSRSHETSIKEIQKEAVACFLQKWTTRPGLGSGRWWRVNTAAVPTSHRIGSLPTEESEDSDDIAHSEGRNLAKMEAEEERRLIWESEQYAAFDDDLDQDENSDCLRGSRWPQWFKHKPVHVIVAAAARPCKGLAKDLFLGEWNGVPCVSTAAAERTFQVLSLGTQSVLERCQESLRHTPRALRCWVRSWKATYYPYAFDLPTAKTIDRYSTVWIQGLCYFFRIHMLARKLKETTVQICGLEFTEAQSSAMGTLWKKLTEFCASQRQLSSEAWTERGGAIGATRLLAIRFRTLQNIVEEVSLCHICPYWLV
jgi:hypothetical protein